MIAEAVEPVADAAEQTGDGWGLGKVFLQPRAVTDLAVGAGITNIFDVAISVAVAKAESQYGIHAWHDNRATLDSLSPGAKVCNVETFERFTIIDPKKGTVRLQSGEVQTYPTTVLVVVSRDVGLWQINIPAWNIGTQIEKDLYIAEQNAAAMFRLYSERHFEPWAAFNSGVYLHSGYAGHAALGVCNLVVEHLNGLGATLPLPLFTTGDLRAKIPSP